MFGKLCLQIVLVTLQSSEFSNLWNCVSTIQAEDKIGRAHV